jgi:AraC-like DNA-binding protein
VAYRELQARTELSDLVACTWERDAPEGHGARETRILPDGCVDLIWRAGELLVAGLDLGPFMSPRPSAGTIVGLRLRPGVAGAALGLPARELRGVRVRLSDLWGRRADELEERMGAAESPAERRAVLEGALAARRPSMPLPDRLVRAAAGLLGLPGSRVGALSRELGVSERQLLRRFDDGVGYGPKTLDRVLRFQRFVARARALAGGEDELARVALDLGYADQPHLSRECVRLSGLTPARLVEQWSYAGSSFPGFMIPAGSSRSFAARISSIPMSPTSARIQGRWSRPTA